MNKDAQFGMDAECIVELFFVSVCDCVTYAYSL